MRVVNGRLGKRNGTYDDWVEVAYRLKFIHNTEPEHVQQTNPTVLCILRAPIAAVTISNKSSVFIHGALK